jgi:hypothetical protein
MTVAIADAAVRDAEPATPVGRDPGPDPVDLPLERVEAEICTLAGQIAAATCRFLRLLAAFDAREGWAGWQVRSCAQWLSWRCGMDLRTAREHVRVARALAGLPQTVEAFSGGRLSYSKVRALTRVATPETEADLVEAALHAPAAQVERLVRGLQFAQDEPAAGPRPLGVQWRWDDDGRLVIWGRLDAADGARLLAGLTRLEHERTAAVEPDDADGSAEADGNADGSAGPGTDGSGASAGPSPRVAGAAPADLGPALVAAAELACSMAEPPAHAPAAEVVVHVDADTLIATARREPDDAEGQAQAGSEPDSGSAGRLEDGPGLRAAMLQMLVCQGRIRLSVDGPDGRTLDLGRRR